VAGPELPSSLARSCAVTSGDGGSIILVGGHGNDTTQSLDTVLQYQGSGGGWTTLPSLLTARRDHACMWVEFETSAGVLVTGGLGPGDEVLSSAEFYDVNTKEWHQVSSMKVARTEHTLSLVYGLPTIVGGVNGDQFIASVEQFDKSSNSWNIPLERDWRIMNTALTLPRYEHSVATIPSSQIENCGSEENEV